MAITPEFNAFAQGYAKGENQVIYTRLAADLDTPVSLMLKLGGAQKDSFMLESVTGGEVRGRYSIVGIKPDLIWKCVETTSSINRSARYDEDAFVAQRGKPLDEFRALLAESHIDLPAELPQSAAGLFGYLGYDMVRHIEHLPNINPDPIGVPDALFLRPSVVAVLDGVNGEVILVSPVWHSDEVSARAA
jgi:anthranilate synthase component 1